MTTRCREPLDELGRERRREGVGPHPVAVVVRMEHVDRELRQHARDALVPRLGVQRHDREAMLGGHGPQNAVGHGHLALVAREVEERQVRDERVRRKGGEDGADAALERRGIPLGDVVRADRDRDDVGLELTNRGSWSCTASSTVAPDTLRLTTRTVRPVTARISSASTPT